jgi:hypothetical protein
MYKVDRYSGKRKRPSKFFSNSRDAYEYMHSLSYGETTVLLEKRGSKWVPLKKNKKTVYK